MREAKNNKENDKQINNAIENQNDNNTFNTLPGVDAILGTASDGDFNVDESKKQHVEEKNINQDINKPIYAQEINPYSNQMYNQNINPDPNQTMYSQNINPDPNQTIYSQNINPDPNQTMYGQNINLDPNQMYGQSMNQDQNQMYGQSMNQDQNQMYGQGMNQDQNQMFGQGMNQDQNQMFGEGFNQDPNQAMYDQNINPNPNQMYEKGMNQDQNQMFEESFNQDSNQAMYDQNINPNLNQMYGQGMNQDQNQMYDQNINLDPNQNVNQQFSANTEESFTRAWMGSYYDNVNNKKFNIGAAFFQGIYLLYRKMYGIGILVIALEEIVSILLSLLLNINKVLALVMDIFIIVLYFVGMGLGFYPLYKGFIKKKYKENSKNTQDPNQLQSIANKNGGTSIAGIFIGIVISTIILLIGITFIYKNLFKLNSNNKSNINTNSIINETEDTTPTEEEFQFFDNYYFTYDGTAWTFDNTNAGLVNGNYTLAYKTSYKAQDLNADFNSQDSLVSLLKLLTDSFTSQVAELNMQVETGSNNFIRQNNCYYAYIDVSASDSISRYYFVVLPDENILFQFVLTEADTAIDYKTNLDVIDMITKIQIKGEDSNNTDQNEVLNTIGNALTNETLEDSNIVNTQNGNSLITNNNTTSTQTQSSNSFATTNTQNGNLSSFINNQ